jgi:hypothetical protein
MENKIMNTFRLNKITLAAMAALISISATTPAWATGSNTTSPAPTPITPAPVVTQTPDLLLPFLGGCAQQYDLAIDLAADAGLAAAGVGAAADVTAIGLQAISEAAKAAEFTVMAGGFTGIATVVGIPVGGAAGAGAAAALAANHLVDDLILADALIGAVADVASVAFGVDEQLLSHYQNSLDNCDQNFTGTVTVKAGGLDVTGTSIFNSDVGVAADVNVEGDVTATQVRATEGISAVGGGIWIGDIGGKTYSDGITIGGGALSGAGVGGAQAFTGHVDAMAIGNNAQATQSGSVALGLDASSTEADAIAIGNAATANGVQDVVVGALNSTGTGGNNTVVGNEIDIIGAASSDNTVLGVGHQVTGSGNFVGGDPNTVVGSLNVATGVNSNVTGDSNVAIGDTVNITGDRAIAVGNNATANADDTTVIGTNAQADATGSAAYGQGAVASLTQQQVFGTTANTYTTPGITSGLSRARQIGALEVATTDTAGNLATDGGKIFDTLSENQAGIAIAMSLGMPDLQADESFGVALNWGRFEDSQAIGVTAMGVVNRDLFGGGERLSLNGAFGVSLDEESFGQRKTHSTTGGRVGFQLTW